MLFLFESYVAFAGAASAGSPSSFADAPPSAVAPSVNASQNAAVIFLSDAGAIKSSPHRSTTR